MRDGGVGKERVYIRVGYSMCVCTSKKVTTSSRVSLSAEASWRGTKEKGRRERGKKKREERRFMQSHAIPPG